MSADPVLYLFDDARARAWVPFSVTRPVGELLHGCLLQRERAERRFGLPCAGHLAEERLAGFREEGTPGVVAGDDVPRERARVVLSSRAVLGEPGPDPTAVEETTAVVAGDEVVGWILPPGAPLPSRAEMDAPAERRWDGPSVELEGEVLAWPWDLVASNAERVAEDIHWLFQEGDSFRLTGVHVLGSEPVVLGKGASVEAGVVLDVRDGPVQLADGSTIRAPARVTGPAYVGRYSTVLGGSLEHVSIGPACKVRGEVEACVFLGYDNKAHDGFLGHAYLGRWVNLGALTTNSDLKNSYGDVRMPLSPGREVETGLLKAGCLIGDHVKTGIGTLLNTGTVVGAGSNLFGGGMPPRWIPPFSWGAGELMEYRLEKFLEVAAAAMARREVDLDDGTEALLRRAWEESRPQRSGA